MTPRQTALGRALACTLVALLAACSSSKKQEEEQTEGATVSSLGRFQEKGFDRKKGEYSHEQRSQFDQKAFTSSTKVNDRKFSTSGYAGRLDYGKTGQYKGSEFSQAGKVSREGAETFSGAGKTSREESKSYSTKDYSTRRSFFGGRKARQGDKQFAGGDETYRTRRVWDAEKSQKQEKKAGMMPKADENGRSVYTETDVVRMLGRN